MDTNVKRREWVKTAAIIFLAVLLVLTFFSNTIMNASLPEVATQQVTQGTINAKIRASGTIAANETYNVKLTQTRKIESVKCRVGDTVAAGDVLFVLEAQESDELKQAKADLESKELEYQKSLINASNDTAQEDRDVQKLRDAYNEALTIYNQYSTMDPSSIAVAKIKAEEALKEAKKDLEQAQKELDAAKSSDEYKNIETEIADLEKKAEPLKTAADQAKADLEATIESLYNEDLGDVSQIKRRVNRWKQDVEDAKSSIETTLKSQGTNLDKYLYLVDKYETNYLFILRLYDNDKNAAGEAVKNKTVAQKLIDKKYATEETATSMAEALEVAYSSLYQYYDKVSNDQMKALSWAKAYLAYGEAYLAYMEAMEGSEDLQTRYKALQASIERYQLAVERAQQDVDDQQERVDDLTSASTAAETVKSAKTALEDKLFEVNKGDTAALDMQAAKKAIEDAKENIAKLTKDADAQEVTAKVAGTIASVSVTAGDTAGADTPIATINQTDRGYTVKITVTNEQAKKVKVGDTAELVNYWGDATATLESIGNDPQNPGKNRQLTFTLTGSDIQPDSNITLAIGQKSASYDAIVPTSAIRTDNNGSFVLAIVSKSTPLSTRYTATRVDVQILASDDKSSAVSGIGSGEFVVTTSTKPIEAGTQVRLAENG